VTEAAGVEWTREFPGQRPPFRPGHELSLVHGARSPKQIAPLAAEYKRQLLDDPDCPPYLLNDKSYEPVIDQWAWARGQVHLLREYVDEHGIVAALTDYEEHEETEKRTKGKTTRAGASRHVRGALDELHRAETRLANLGGRLGLDPLSRARIGRDLSQSRFYANATPLDTALAEMERRRELTAGSTDE
jgi:hypothetical protein